MQVLNMTLISENLRQKKRTGQLRKDNKRLVRKKGERKVVGRNESSKVGKIERKSNWQ